MIIGITGGIGSGKSTITQMLQDKYGYTVLRTDDIAKELEEPGHEVYDRLKERFGSAILDGTAEHRIDKKAFAALIYQDPEAMKAAEEIIHPATWGYCEDVIAKKKAAAEKGSRARVVVESALPCERYRRMCDEIWYVFAEASVRTIRLMETRGYSLEKCREIINEQISDEEYIGFSDYIIDNSSDLSEAKKRVDELMEAAVPEESV